MEKITHLKGKEIPAIFGLTLASFALALALVTANHEFKIISLLTYPFDLINTTPEGSQHHKEQSTIALDSDFSLEQLITQTDLLVDLIENKKPKPSFSSASNRYIHIIEDVSDRYAVSPVLVKSIIQAESNFNPNAISQNGAVGLMQIMPSTARAMGIKNIHEPKNNIEAGVKYLRHLLNAYNDDERLAIAAYNCGPEAMKRFGGRIPPYKETLAFVEKVMLYYDFHLEG